MSRLPVILFITLVGLVAVVTGCGGSSRYDARLVAADSLVSSLPDDNYVITLDPPVNISFEGYFSIY